MVCCTEKELIILKNPISYQNSFGLVPCTVAENYSIKIQIHCSFGKQKILRSKAPKEALWNNQIVF